ncbi:MAG: TonB-dependent receptor [Acidobacteriia bacterium]|nr:TonB-dependent receptor [Terriglobia bacterium]
MSSRRAILLLAVFLIATTAASAQVAGSLSGSVIDPSGAVVPNATVNIYLAGGKEPVLAGKTNEVGLFVFIAMRPDTYDVGVEAQGFIKTTVRLVKVSPLQQVELPAIQLELQTAAQTVEVTSNVQSVQSTNAEVASTITNTMVQNLPVLGRQVTTFFQSQPGVSVGGDATSVNGLKSSFSNVTLDGINIQDNFIRTNGLDYAPFRTTIDQVAEITVATSNQSAAIGGGASQFILSTKSGSNAFHGSVYWYNRNNALSANDWFNDRDGVAQPKLNLNQPGAAVGGPIKKDKLFFYANVELYRDKEDDSITRTVLTDSARNGIFTYVDTSGNTRTANLQTLRGYTPDPTIKAMISQLPEPNSTGGDGLNTSGYRFNAKSNEYRDQFVYKGDYYITQKHSITGTYNYINNPTDRPDITTSQFYTVTPPVTNSLRNHLLSVALRSTISPTFTNEVRAGFARTHGNFDDNVAYPKFAISNTNLLFSNPVNTFLNQGRDTNTYPVQDNANWIKGKHQIAFGFQFQRIITTPFNDGNGASETGIMPTYRLGISAANTTGLTTADLAGIRSTDLTRANNLYANLAGIITQATQTFNVTSATSGFVPGATNLRNLSYSTYAGYIQDSWKLRPNLTINLGMRYEYWTPLDEKNGLYLAPVLENNSAKTTLMDPNAVLNFIGGPSGRPFYNADKNNFAPNVGFAWDPFKQGKTSIRGGYMMAYVNDNVVTTVRNSVNTNSGLTFPNTVSNLVAFLSSPPTVPAPTYKVPRTLADNYAISKTSAIGLPDPNLTTPMVHQWNLSVQQEAKGFLFAARYVGNKGSDLLRAVDYNQVLYNANGFLADFQRAQSNGTLAQTATGAYNPAYNASVPGSQPLTVFPLLGSGGLLTNATIQSYIRNGQIGQLADTYMTNGLNGSVNFYTNPVIQGGNALLNGGSSIFHSLQLEATRRTRAGLQMQFSYVYGKSLANVTGDGQTNFEPLLDNANPNLEWARSPYDIRHAFKANYYYELPFGAGKKWSSTSAVNRLIGGWALSGIWSYYSGSPYSILTGASGVGWGTFNRDARSTYTNTASVAGTTWPQLQGLTSGVFKTGDNIYFLSPTLLGADGRGTSQPGTAPFAGQVLFNPNAGTVGNLQRRMFSGPWDWSWDVSVKKTVAFTERHTLDLHFDFFNVINHPTFYMYPTTAGDYSAASPYQINNTTFGQFDTMNHNPRVLQIGAYYRF